MEFTVYSWTAVMFLSLRTARSVQTQQTQIRLIWSGSTLFAIAYASFGCIILFFFYLFFFNLGFTTCQDYFTHFEMGQKWEIPEKNHLTTCKQNLACLTCPEQCSNPQRWDNERFRTLNMSGLNHSSRSSLTWVYTVCIDLSVWKLRIIMVV